MQCAHQNQQNKKGLHQQQINIKYCKGVQITATEQVNTNKHTYSRVRECSPSPGGIVPPNELELRFLQIRGK